MDLKKIAASKWISIFMVYSFVLGCNSEESPIISNYMTVQIDGKEFTYADEDLSVNENCNFIFINSATVQVDDQRFRLGFQLTKSGRIREIFCLDFSNSSAVASAFKSADFLASEVFAISNFELSEAEGTLSFDFNGLLYELDQGGSTKGISGRIETKALQLTDCSVNQWLLGTIDQQPFEAVEMEGETITSRNAQDQIISIQSSWRGISDDGFRISIVTDAELEDMATGTYPFGEKDLLNVVKFEKYLGPYEAVQLEQHRGAWQAFECSGEFVIDEQTGGARSRTNGTFSLNASKDGEIVFSIINGTFSI
ncbi:MAG: hypothetical protein AAF519_10080 [Bacteroidota bacterium]